MASLEKTVPYLGIEWQMQTDSQNSDAHDSTVSVRRVIADSPASKAGILEGDVIRSVDGTALDAQNTLSTLIMARKPGAAVTLALQRGGKRTLVKVTLGMRELPAYRFRPVEGMPFGARTADVRE